MLKKLISWLLVSVMMVLEVNVVLAADEPVSIAVKYVQYAYPEAAHLVNESCAHVDEENDNYYLVVLSPNWNYMMGVIVIVQKGTNNVVYASGCQDYFEIDSYLDEADANLYADFNKLNNNNGNVSVQEKSMKLNDEVLSAKYKNADYIIKKYGTPTSFDSGAGDPMGRQMYYTSGLSFDMCYGKDYVRFIYGTITEMVDGFNNDSYSFDDIAKALSIDGKYKFEEGFNYGHYPIGYDHININVDGAVISIECINGRVNKNSRATIMFDLIELSNYISVLFNGEALSLSTPAIRDTASGSVLVPIADIVDVMGGTSKWDNKNKIATITKDNTEVKLQIGSSTAYVDGTSKALLAAPVISNGKTMVPLRFVAEAFGAEVNWNGENSTASIDYAA